MKILFIRFLLYISKSKRRISRKIFARIRQCIYHSILLIFDSLFLLFLLSGSFTFLQNNEVFWILFATLALSITLVATFSHSFSHVTCSIFSSFAIILPIDYWVGSSLKYIVINIVRRATVEDFNLAIVQPPIQSKGIMFCNIYRLKTVTVTIRIFILFKF